jgi:hypothetical protein
MFAEYLRESGLKLVVLSCCVVFVVSEVSGGGGRTLELLTLDSRIAQLLADAVQVVEM